MWSAGAGAVVAAAPAGGVRLGAAGGSGVSTRGRFWSDRYFKGLGVDVRGLLGIGIGNVIRAKAGIHVGLQTLGPRFRGDDRVLTT